MAARLKYELLKHTGPKYKIPTEVAEDIRKVDTTAFRTSWIRRREPWFWKTPYAGRYHKLERRIIHNDENVYSGIEIEDLYPLIRTMRETTEGMPGVMSDVYFPVRVRLPVIPKKSSELSHDTIRIGYGQVVNHFDELFPGGVYEPDNAAPMDFTFMETGEDPLFNVEILQTDAKTLREAYVLEMNENKLRGFYNRSGDPAELKANLKDRGYRIRHGELLTLYYMLQAPIGRRKELPPIPLNPQ